MMAFWQSGNPRQVQEGIIDAITGRKIGFNADPGIDLYKFQAGAPAGRYQVISGTSYNLAGDTITETHTYADKAADDIRDLVIGDIEAKVISVMDGGILYKAGTAGTWNGSLMLRSDLSITSALTGSIERATRGIGAGPGFALEPPGTDLEPELRFMTLDGQILSAGATPEERLANIKAWSDQINQHREAARIVGDQHIINVNNLPDTPTANISGYNYSATSVYPAAHPSYALGQGWPANPVIP